MKLTDRIENANLDDNDLLHIVDVSNISQSPKGSSFKVKLLSLVNYIRQKAITFSSQITFSLSPIFSALNAGQYVKTDGTKKLTTVATIPYSDITGTPTALPPSGAASGELTGTYPSPNLLESAVTAKLLTGLPAFANTQITNTQSILQAFSNLQGQINAGVAVLQTGNTLFVSLYAPTANDLQTRAQALGRMDKSFKTIQAAINVANTGDSIIVFAGTYTENLDTRPKTLSLLFFDVILVGRIICNGGAVNGNFTSSIQNGTDRNTLYSESAITVQNFKSIIRTVAYNSAQADIYISADSTFQNIENFGNSAFPLRLSSASSNKTLTLKNAQNVWIDSYTTSLNMNCYQCGIDRVAYENSTINSFYFKDCAIRKSATSLYFSMYKLILDSCKVYISNQTTTQLAEMRDSNSYVEINNTEFQSTSPTTNYLFKKVSANPNVFIMKNCFGNVPLANLKDFTATNENSIDYEYLSFATTVNEINI